MKKALSLFLAAVMSLGIFTMAASVSAAEEPDLSIDSAEEYVNLVEAINAGNYNDKKGRKFEVKTDLDLSAYSADEVTIKVLWENQIIDFAGHTVSGIVREVSLDDHGDVGLLADKTDNYGELLNVKIKDCKLSVTIVADRYAMVGGVVGNANRGHVNSVEMENVTIELKGDGTGAVGMLYGQKAYNDFRDADVSLVMKNVVIDAANAPVGLIVGRQGDNDGDTIAVKKVDISNTTIKGSNEVKSDTYIGTGNDNNKAGLSVAEGASLSVSLVDNATGYQPPKQDEPSRFTLDGKLDDWKDVHTISIVGSGANEGKKATFYAVLTDEGLYLACDAYHQLYKTTEDAWWKNSALEIFFAKPGQEWDWYNRDTLGHVWSSAMGKELGKLVDANVNGEIGEYQAKIITEEVSNAGDNVKYHTVTELFLPNTIEAVKNSIIDGAIRVGVCWKTPEDKCNNGEAEAGKDAEDWIPAKSWRENGDMPFVTASGIYLKSEYEELSKDPVTPPPTGSTSVAVAAVAMIALAGAMIATRKREQD